MPHRLKILARLFDASFDESVTVRVAGVLFWIIVGAAALAGLAIAIYGWRLSPLAGVVSLVAGITVFGGTVLLGRAGIEVALAVFRVREHLAEMVEHEAEIAVNTGRPPADALRPSAPPT